MGLFVFTNSESVNGNGRSGVSRRQEVKTNRWNFRVLRWVLVAAELALDPDWASPVLAWPLSATKPALCFYLFIYFKLLLFWEGNGVSLCSLSWPVTLKVDKAGLELPEILVCAGIAGVHHHA